MTDIPVYPLETESSIRGLNIQQALDEGTPMFVNPIDDQFIEFNSEIARLKSDIQNTLPCIRVETATVAVLQLDADLVELEAVTTTLNSHMDTLLFGDEEGTIISGGFSSNVGQANSANTLFNTVAGLVGDFASCDLFDEFFGSLLGGANELLNRALDAMAIALGAVGRLMSAVGAAVQEMVDLINQVIAEVQALINEMIAMVLGEIQAFTDWLQRQLDLALGNFLAALGAIPCIDNILVAIQTPELDILLNAQL